MSGAGKILIAVLLSAIIAPGAFAANGIDTDGSDLPVNVGGQLVANFTAQKNLDMVTGGVKLGQNAGACDDDREGTIRYSKNAGGSGQKGLEFCDGEVWQAAFSGDNFGGTYAVMDRSDGYPMCVIENPKTKSCSCPLGKIPYIIDKVEGTRFNSQRVYLCQ